MVKYIHEVGVVFPNTVSVESTYKKGYKYLYVFSSLMRKARRAPYLKDEISKKKLKTFVSVVKKTDVPAFTKDYRELYIDTNQLDAFLYIAQTITHEVAWRCLDCVSTRDEAKKLIKNLQEAEKLIPEQVLVFAARDFSASFPQWLEFKSDYFSSLEAAFLLKSFGFEDALVIEILRAFLSNKVDHNLNDGLIALYHFCEALKRVNETTDSKVESFFDESPSLNHAVANVFVTRDIGFDQAVFNCVNKLPEDTVLSWLREKGIETSRPKKFVPSKRAPKVFKTHPEVKKARILHGDDVLLELQRYLSHVKKSKMKVTLQEYLVLLDYILENGSIDIQATLIFSMAGIGKGEQA
ncbi:MAG: hypothetical protein QM632_06740, partial [Micrococcaceae bacterium]